MPNPSWAATTTAKRNAGAYRGFAAIFSSPEMTWRATHARKSKASPASRIEADHVSTAPKASTAKKSRAQIANTNAEGRAASSGTETGAREDCGTSKRREVAAFIKRPFPFNAAQDLRHQSR